MAKEINTKDLSNNILVIEDSDTKYESIMSALVNNGVSNINREKAVNPALRRLFYTDFKPSMIILDMQFPLYEDTRPQCDSGLRILRELKRRNYPIPVVICSCNVPEHAATEVQNVIGFILFDYSVDYTETMKSYLIKAEEFTWNNDLIQR